MKLAYKHTLRASCIGYVVQAIVNNYAPLLFLIFVRTYSIPLEKITILITINFCIQLLVDLLSTKLIDKIGYRVSVIFAHISAFLGLAGLAILPDIMSYTGIIISVVMYAVGGGLLEVLVSPLVEACPTENKSGTMSLLHSFYCWGSVMVVAVSALFMRVFGQEHWRILAVVWAVLPLLNGIYFLFVPIWELNDSGDGIPIRKLFGMKIFWIFMVLMLMSGAAELSMSQWASAFAESGLGVSKTAGDLMGPCLFAIFMGIARTIYARAGDKSDLLVLLIISGALCTVSYIAASLASNIPILSFIGCAVCGLSVGIMWPGVYSLAAKECPKGGTAMFALLALAGDCGCMSGPTMVGFVANTFGGALKCGLFTAALFPAVLLVLSIYLKRKTAE